MGVVAPWRGAWRWWPHGGEHGGGGPMEGSMEVVAPWRVVAPRTSARISKKSREGLALKNDIFSMLIPF